VAWCGQPRGCDSATLLASYACFVSCVTGLCGLMPPTGTCLVHPFCTALVRPFVALAVRMCAPSWLTVC
jgi:hypothetical protein